MRLINADAIIAALESFSDRANGNQHYLNGIETARELIAESDEAVVRCGECKHLVGGICMEFADSGINPSASDFCSYGERRTDVD